MKKGNIKKEAYKESLKIKNCLMKGEIKATGKIFRRFRDFKKHFKEKPEGISEYDWLIQVWQSYWNMSDKKKIEIKLPVLVEWALQLKIWARQFGSNLSRRFAK